MMEIILSAVLGVLALLGIWRHIEGHWPWQPAPTRSRSFLGSVFKAAYDKDPELYDLLAPRLGPKDFRLIWQRIYPEDFPDGENTLISDASAIKPRSTDEGWEIFGSYLLNYESIDGSYNVNKHE